MIRPHLQMYSPVVLHAGIVNRIIRELGPISQLTPPVPMVSGTITPPRIKSESLGSEDFAQMWSGQSAHLGQELPAGALTKRLAEEALAKLGIFTGSDDLQEEGP